MLAPLGARISLLTNGTRLSPALVKKITSTGADVEFDIHLSAADPQEFRRIHQSPLYSPVMRRLTELAGSHVAQKVEIHISMQGFGRIQRAMTCFPVLNGRLPGAPSWYSVSSPTTEPA